MAPVTLDKITKVYPNGFQAVTDLSLELEDGEFMVLVGPSGCGQRRTSIGRPSRTVRSSSTATVNFGGGPDALRPIGAESCVGEGMASFAR